MFMYYIYWIKALHHTDPYSEGYVGCSNQPERRFRSHTTDNTRAGSKIVKAYVMENGINSVSIEILHTVPDEVTGKQIERSYRPKANIGWNIQVGGLKNPDCTGRVDSDSTRQKRSASISRTRAIRKAKNPNAYKSKFKGVTNRWTDEQKELIGSYHKGKTISQEHRESARNKLLRGNSSHAKRIAIRDLETDVVTIYYSISQVQDYLPISQPCIKSAKRRYLLTGAITTMKNRYQIVPEQGED